MLTGIATAQKQPLYITLKMKEKLPKSNHLV
jgi:hypothetical protein